MAQREEIGPYDNVLAGTCLFTLVEPHHGHEVTYNRWYERDHFYAGCLIGAGWFAGKRWVATRPLKDLRFPSEGDFLPDVDAGSYLATYWVQKGVDGEAIAWGSEQVRWLHENGRMYGEREHIHTLMYVLRWSIQRDLDSVPTALALDHPWAGLVAVMVERTEDGDAKEFSAWLRDTGVPDAIDGSDVALAVGMTPIPLPEGAPVFQPENPNHDRRVAVLCFVDRAAAGPEGALETVRTLDAAMREAGVGHVAYAAPFLPTIPGTDTYTDQLW